MMTTMHEPSTDQPDGRDIASRLLVPEFWAASPDRRAGQPRIRVIHPFGVKRLNAMVFALLAGSSGG
jgi:hypothetical protein